MPPLWIVRLVFALAITGYSGSGFAATVVNFDALTDLENVDDQFIDLGIDFGGTAEVLSVGGGLLADLLET